METVSKSGTSERIACTLENHLGYWLRLVSNEVSGAFARALQERHISVAEWVALNQIAGWKEATSAALAVRMGMTRGGVSKILDKLESKQLISRTASETDHRVQLLALSAKGRRALPALTGIADANDRRFFEVLGARKQAVLKELLQELADAHEMRRVPVA